jgi:hypothetical protein
MQEITKWVADDGKEFDDEYDCRVYEWNVRLNAVKDQMKWYNSDGDKLEVSFRTDFAYATFVQVDTSEAAEVLYDFCYDQGYYCPCVDENNRFDPDRLGRFWWDDGQERWLNLREEKEKITSMEIQLTKIMRK